MSAVAPLYSEVTGQGPPLALLHGWSLNLRVFESLAQQLAPTHTVHALDLPGHGRSDGALLPVATAPSGELLDETVARVLASLPERFALLGWSLGGQIALALAAQAPERVSALILVATTPRFTASTDWPHGVSNELLQRLATQLDADYRQTVSEFLELQVRGSRDATATLHRLQRALLAHGGASHAVLQQGLQLLAAVDLRSVLGKVSAPTLVIGGQYDRITPPAASRWLAQHLPQASFHEFARAAHAPFLSHGDEFSSLLERFLVSGVPLA